MLRNRHCPRCDRDTRQEVSRRVSANLAEHFGWWCLECHWWTPSKSGGNWIPKENLVTYGVDLSLVRVAEVIKGERCARCGRRGAELHHWAPRAMFEKEEAESWPKDYLCKACHDEWHRKVTPQLVDGHHD